VRTDYAGRRGSSADAEASEGGGGSASGSPRRAPMAGDADFIECCSSSDSGSGCCDGAAPGRGAKRARMSPASAAMAGRGTATARGSSPAQPRGSSMHTYFKRKLPLGTDGQACHRRHCPYTSACHNYLDSCDLKIGVHTSSREYLPGTSCS